MRTYQKFNESKKAPNVGDYVLCEEEDSGDIQNFLRNNIGRVIPEPENVPKMGWEANLNFIWVLFETKFEPDHDDNFVNNIRPFYKYEIEYFSPNKEDVEDVMSANKYNL